MNTESILKETQERFIKTLENFEFSISGVGSKATPALFNAIRVEAYGDHSPISSLATITRGREKGFRLWRKTHNHHFW
jgi:ribosome recycling factor